MILILVLFINTHRIINKVRGYGGCEEDFLRERLERPLEQILVVVAITQVRDLWAEEEKGFIRTVIGYELVDLKLYTRVVNKFSYRKCASIF